MSIRRLALVSHMVSFVLTLSSGCFVQAIEVKPDVSSTPTQSKPTSPVDYSDIEKLLNEKYDGKANTTSKPSKIYLSILKGGFVQWLYVYNTCGQPDIDDAVKQSVSSIEEFPPREKGIAALAVLEPQAKLIKVTSIPPVDWSVYMTKIQADIKSNWVPPKGTRTERAVARFKLYDDGRITDFRFDTPTNEPLFDRAAKEAIDKLKPRAFPPEAPDYVEIQFSFSYNMKKGINPNSKIILPTSDKLIARVIESDKENPIVHSGVVSTPMILNNDGVNATNAKRFDVAISKLKQAVLADSRYHLALHNLSIAYNNAGLEKRSDPQAALALFHRAYFFGPTSATAYQNVEGVVMLLGKSPNSFDDRKQLGMQAEAKNDYISALVEYAAASAIKQDPDLCIRMGDLYAKYGAEHLAMAQYVLAKKLDDVRADERIAKLKPAKKTH